MDETGHQERSTGRHLPVEACGPDAGALEADALGKAREFFGPDIRLEIKPGYGVDRRDYKPAELRYFARITVREIPEGQ